MPCSPRNALTPLLIAVNANMPFGVASTAPVFDCTVKRDYKDRNEAKSTAKSTEAWYATARTTTKTAVIAQSGARKTSPVSSTARMT